MKRNKEETIKKIKSASLKHFSEKGFAGARIDEIAEEAGINKATIYYHIGDKSTLYTITMTSLFEDLKNQILESVEKESTPQTKLRTFIYMLHKMKHKYPQLPPLMLRELASKGANMSEDFIKSIYQVIRIFMDIVENGYKKGVFRKVNAFMIYTTVIGSSLVFHAGYSVFSNVAKKGVIPEKDLPEYDPKVTSELIYDYLIKSLENKDV